MNRWKSSAPWLLAVAFVLIAGWQGCEARGWRNRTAVILDSSTVWQSRAGNADRLNSRLQERIDALGMAVVFQKDTAARFRNQADSIRRARRAIVPVPEIVGDSLGILRATEAMLDNCEEESAALRQESGALMNAIATGEARAKLLEESRDTLSAALTTGRRVIVDLHRQLASASPPCRIAFWACPSRTSIAIGSASIATVATYILVKR